MAVIIGLVGVPDAWLAGGNDVKQDTKNGLPFPQVGPIISTATCTTKAAQAIKSGLKERQMIP